jgi:hypothetical protein
VAKREQVLAGESTAINLVKHDDAERRRERKRRKREAIDSLVRYTRTASGQLVVRTGEDALD